MTLPLPVKQFVTVMECVSAENPNVPACAANRIPLYNTDAYIPATMPLLLSRFECLDVSPRPWSKQWDFNGNGTIDTEDMLKKAFFSDPEVLAETWDKAPVIMSGFIARLCQTVRATDVYGEALWRYQTIIAETHDGAGMNAAVQQIHQVEQYAALRMDGFKEFHGPNDVQTSANIKTLTDAIREMADDAIRVVRGGYSPAVFGIGVYLSPPEGSSAPYPLQVTGVHEAGGAAAAGLMRGDVVVTLDGTRYDGSVSLKSGVATGFSGPRDSVVRVGVLRFGQAMEFTAQRNICALRHLDSDIGIMGARNLVFTK